MTISRRKLIKWGLGATVAVPAAMEVRWLSRDFTRADYSTKAPIVAADHRLWQNWSGLQVVTPKEIFSPATEEELVAKIVNAQGHIRPVGSGHSFIDIVPTDDTMVDISQLSGLYSVDTEAKTAVFGAGTRLRQAARLAAEHGLAFPNLPDIDVQTLAGSFATATHGTGRELKALHSNVIGFRLITAGGEVMDVSRDSNPELFDAGLVSLGTLGVITQYTLQLRDLFALTRKVFLVPTDEAIETMYQHAGQHHYFEFFVLPHTGYSALITHDPFDGELSGREPSKDEDFIATFKTLRDVLGWWPWARKKAFAAYVATQVSTTGIVEDETDEYWKLLSTARVTKMNEMEYHLPEANGQQALREVVAVMEGRADTFFPIEVRFTGQDNAWLSPFNGGNRVSIAVHALASENYQMFFDLVEPIHQHYGGRPHWGKLHSMGAEQLLPLYPDFAEFQALRKTMDPQGKFLNPRTAAIFGESWNG